MKTTEKHTRAVVRLTCPDGSPSHLSARGKTSWSIPTVRKHLREFLAAFPQYSGTVETFAP